MHSTAQVSKASSDRAQSVEGTVVIDQCIQGVVRVQRIDRGLFFGPITASVNAFPAGYAVVVENDQFGLLTYVAFQKGIRSFCVRPVEDQRCFRQIVSNVPRRCNL